MMVEKQNWDILTDCCVGYILESVFVHWTPGIYVYFWNILSEYPNCFRVRAFHVNVESQTDNLIKNNLIILITFCWFVESTVQNNTA
jgi:hypothetical protein